MLLSVWRYAHLTLALVASGFIVIASLSGIVLACDAAWQETQAQHTVQDAGNPSLKETLTRLRSEFLEVFSLTVDAQDRLLVSGINLNGEMVHHFVDPLTGQSIGSPQPSSKLVQFSLSLHRSLFLKTTGRIIVAVISFLLFLITLTGFSLLLKRQLAWQYIFSLISKDHFHQQAHTLLGRLLLIPIILIALSGLYLSLERFSVIPEMVAHPLEVKAKLHEAKEGSGPEQLFSQIKLSKIREIQLPFSEQPEDLFILSLLSRELKINQFSGEVVVEAPYPWVQLLGEFTKILHTGEGSWLWSGVLGFSTASLFFFIFSGFKITTKRRQNQPKKQEQLDNCPIAISVGSETGSTWAFAQHLQEVLDFNGLKSHLGALNKLTVGSKTEKILILTATHGLGQPPSNARYSERQINFLPKDRPLQFAILGFGSKRYPDYCKFAYQTQQFFEEATSFKPLLPVYTVNDQNQSEYEDWLKSLAASLNLSLPRSYSDFALEKSPSINLQTIKLLQRTVHGHVFTLQLAPPKGANFQSGDLLGLKPQKANEAERLYSIAKRPDNSIFLSIRHFEKGQISPFLKTLPLGQKIKAQLISNLGFNLPKGNNPLVLVSNGTGLAPFLGMVSEMDKNREVKLYWGARSSTDGILYQNWLDELLESRPKLEFIPVYSRERDCQYVQYRLNADAQKWEKNMIVNATLMLCGSLNMQNGVLAVLEDLGQRHSHLKPDLLRAQGRLLSDCY